MNKFKTISLSLLLGLSFASCEDMLEDNMNKDVAHNNTVDQAMPVVVFYSSQTVYDHAEYNVYLSQCLTTTGKTQTGSYPYKQGWEFLNINRHPQWRRHFYDLAKNARSVCNLSGSTNTDLIARTIMLMSTQLTTDTFGPMPMLPEQGGNAHVATTPHYEDQLDIYTWMFKEADALIALFEDESRSTTGDVTVDAKMDRIYNGDLNKWKGLVYAIKARLLLRNIPNVNTSYKMCDEIIATAQKAIDTWRSGDLLYGSWFGNEPRYKYDGGSTESNAPWSSAQPKINSWESRDNRLAADAVPSKFFMEACLGISFPGNERKQGTWDRGNGFGNDPRILLLMKPAVGPMSAAISNTANMYRYLENNIGTGATFKRTHYPDLYCGAYAGDIAAYNPLFTMEELYFIQAEAYYWKNNKDKACQLAKEATEWNIQRHLDFYLAYNGGVYPTDYNATTTVGTEYDANMWKARFESYKGAFLSGEKTVVEYVSGVDSKTGALKTSKATAKSVKEFGNERYFFNASEYTLSDLMMQKYISMYMQPEQWTDMRRYHYSNKRNGIGVGTANEIVYPSLRRPYNLYSAYWVDGLSDTEKESTWIQRLNYDPQTEDVYNKDEVIRVGAYKDFKWLRKPMIWAQNPGEVTSLTSGNVIDSNGDATEEGGSTEENETTEEGGSTEEGENNTEA